MTTRSNCEEVVSTAQARNNANYFVSVGVRPAVATGQPRAPPQHTPACQT
jgi:hypothetical protein